MKSKQPRWAFTAKRKASLKRAQKVHQLYVSAGKRQLAKKLGYDK